MDAGRRAGTQDILDTRDYTLDADAAARLLGVSVDTIRRYARKGTLASLRVQGERIIEYRFRPADVEAMQAGKQAHTGTQIDMPTQVPTQAGALVADLLERLEERYHAEIAAKDDLIAELRRRAELAERALADRQAPVQPPSILTRLLMRIFGMKEM